MEEKKVKVKKPFYKRWWFILIVVFVVISAIGSAGGGDEKKLDSSTPSQETSSLPNDGSSDATSETPADSEPAPSAEPDIVKFSDGLYKVGSDIPSGLYRVDTDGLMNLAYFERLKDSNMNFDSIISNITFNNDGYVRILDTDAFFKVQGATIYPFDIDSAQPSFLDEYEDGIFLVGIDIAPGEYKVAVTDTLTGIGYLERLNDVSGSFNSIIANSAFENQTYITVDASDFAIKVQGCKLTKSN